MTNTMICQTFESMEEGICFNGSSEPLLPTSLGLGLLPPRNGKDGPMVEGVYVVDGA